MIYLIVGNSGSGKTTQAKLLQKQCNFHKIITYTTRPKRINEKNHIDYHFINLDEFNNLKKENKLIGITNFSNNYYAIPKCELNKYKNSKDNCILVIDLKGVKEIKKSFNALSIYLKIDEKSMIERMKNRNEDNKIVEERINCKQNFDDFADFTINANQSEEEIYKEILSIIEKTSV